MVFRVENSSVGDLIKSSRTSLPRRALLQHSPLQHRKDYGWIDWRGKLHSQVRVIFLSKIFDSSKRWILGQNAVIYNLFFKILIFPKFRWLSVYGAPIGVSLPPQIFTMPEVTNGVVPPNCTINGSAPNGATIKENGEVSTRSISEASQSSQSEDGSC